MTLDAAELQTRFLAACAIAREAGQLARRRFSDRTSFTVAFKGPQDYLTEVDGEVERLIASALHASFPDDGFIGEEGDGRTGAAGAPIWVVDPIDGTANFARGVPHYCVSIACLLGRQVEIGVIYDPNLDELFTARRQGGARLNGAKIETAKTRELTKASIELGLSRRYDRQLFLRLADRVLAAGASILRSGSGALALAYVAAGRCDGYIEHHINAWDCLAGNLLVSEAGGYVSDFLANDGLRRGNALLAAAPLLKEDLTSIAGFESSRQ